MEKYNEILKAKIARIQEIGAMNDVWQQRFIGFVTNSHIANVPIHVLRHAWDTAEDEETQQSICGILREVVEDYCFVRDQTAIMLDAFDGFLSEICEGKEEVEGVAEENFDAEVLIEYKEILNTLLAVFTEDLGRCYELLEDCFGKVEMFDFMFTNIEELRKNVNDMLECLKDMSIEISKHRF